ncbi:MAG TPA: hypothetical protein VNM22_05855 [Candidatus Limnocylindrales bacterium]|nr:hypothetical protein [Candidatus Limnocylindrales bacterium]
MGVWGMGVWEYGSVGVWKCGSSHSHTPTLFSLPHFHTPIPPHFFHRR